MYIILKNNFLGNRLRETCPERQTDRQTNSGHIIEFYQPADSKVTEDRSALYNIMNIDSEYMKIHIFELRKKQSISERSSQLYTQLKQLRKLSLKKIQA